MSIPSRIAIMMTLVLSLARVMSAQTTTTTATKTDTAATATTTTTATTTATTTTAADGEESGEPALSASQSAREQFTNLLADGPPEVPAILKLDPTLLSNEGYLSGYPELAKFVAAHPEVRRNPRFYLSAFRDPGESSRMAEHLMESISIVAVFTIVAFALAWLVRTIIEQKRWNRLTRTQTEVHTKILDRFSTSDELLSYIKTPAGSKFLESAPIPLHAEKPMHDAPVARVMWSIQIGIVVASASLGLLLISNRFDKESAQGLLALGTIGFSTGIGFMISAVISLFLAKRIASHFHEAAAEIVK
jgi:hypothetical protein